ncbi:hypothetical protein BDA96_04G115400 [Sorghum bicolor]|uniref:Uncharacterized protein n=1 Tax=Sorghum bicolor TaxID=4558 RepID=A0A921R372_SORBI|nr:hypothetical protein BDA96_04G115400 [Sorghum bicolor]
MYTGAFVDATEETYFLRSNRGVLHTFFVPKKNAILLDTLFVLKKIKKDNHRYLDKCEGICMGCLPEFVEALLSYTPASVLQRINADCPKYCSLIYCK